MPRSRYGRHRRRSTTAAARVIGMPALVALAGTLVASVPNYASADQLQVSGMQPVLACHGSGTPSASASPSDSTSPTGSASASGLPSASASGSDSDSQGSTSASASASATTSATPQPSGSGDGRPTTTATASAPTSNGCAVTKAGSPKAPPTHSPSATASPQRSVSPSRSATPTTSLSSAPAVGSSGSEAGQAPVVGQEPYGPITRAQILQRALAWIEQKVPYSQTAWWVDSEGSYRQDCSGYVSMAWGLDQAIDFWTGNLDTVSHQIPGDQLLPGDILLSPTHTVLFAGWADSAHTTFDFYEESHPGTVAHYVTGASLAAYLGAGFLPYRYDGVIGPSTGPFVAPPAGVPIAALGPLAQELAPEGKTVSPPAPAWWQTVPAPTPTQARPSTAAAREAELEPAAAEMPEQEDGPAGVALGGSVLLFAGLSVTLARRRSARPVGRRPRRRH
jgi:hypothetical protein